MKKLFLAFMLSLTLGVTQMSFAASAPKHRYTPKTQVDNKQAVSATEQPTTSASQDAVEAYSDTTSVDTTSAQVDADDSNQSRSHSIYSLDRMIIMEMSMEKVVDVPEEQRPIDKQSDEYLIKRGLRNFFLGAGLVAMFAFWHWHFMAGIGALVSVYGLGQLAMGYIPNWKNK